MCLGECHEKLYVVRVSVCICVHVRIIQESSRALCHGDEFRACLVLHSVSEHPHSPHWNKVLILSYLYKKPSEKHHTMFDTNQTRTQR